LGIERKIFRHPSSARSVFVRSNLAGSSPGLSMPPKLEHSIPAPSSIAVKKKVRNYETRRKKHETSNFHPSNHHYVGFEKITF
jgi:hypothetical protein